VLESRHLQGYWWLPSLPDGKVPGTLHFSQADIELELLGGFPQPLDGSSEGDGQEGEGPQEVVVALDSFLTYQPRILGQAQNGEQVTLEGCNGRSLQLGFPRFATSAYGPHFVLIGAWYEPGEEVVFDEITIRYSDLDTWACTSGFEVELNPTLDATGVASLESTFTPPEEIEAVLDEGTTLKVEFPYTVSGMRPLMTELHITQGATIRIVFDTPANIEESLTYVASLRNFLSLAVGRPIRVLSVHGFHNPPADAESDPLTRLRPHKVDVEILYRLVGLPEAPARELHPTEMLFTLADIHPRLEQILSTWFAKQELLGPVLARYFHLVHMPPTSVENEFENLVRVLETHHRRTVGAAGRTSEHEERLSAIQSSVPEEYREWLEKKLKYSHELTLPERLAGALERCPTITSRLIGDSARKKNSFVRKVASTRNYQTHLEPSGQAEAARGARLVTLVKQLRPLVEMTLLLEIGFSCDEVAALFDREGHRYREVEHFKGLA
jgi:ApeA N-terminal domain 1